MRLFSYLLVAVLISTFSFNISLGQTSIAESKSMFLDQINVPKNTTPEKQTNQILIAVIDDGVRLTHQDVGEFIWSNPKEIPDNKLDDDGNGYVDDLHGWDISDGDNNASPPEGRSEFYHGTHVSGIITQIAKRAYGDKAQELIKIVPIKTISDNAENKYLKDAYKGIEYAIDIGADIILCACSQAVINDEQIKILERAEDNGILIVASSGNWPEEKEQFPAAYPKVLAVGALDKNGQKSENSNFGKFVDISAPGVDIKSAGARSDDSYETHEGTSFSAAMLAAAAAMVKLKYPEYSNDEIKACLLSSTDLIEVSSSNYYGKIGAGKLDVENALRCSILNNKPEPQNLLTHPKGYIYYNDTLNDSVTWTIDPKGDYKGIWVKPIFNRNTDALGTLDVYTGKSSDGSLVGSYSLNSIPEKIFITGSSAFVEYKPGDSNERSDWLLKYEVETIDFTRLYCDGTKYRDTEGSLVDGSGPNDYAYHSDCKWIITAPEGKVINFKFKDIDTEPKTDWVYFFNGSGTQQKAMMARVSGPDVPPEFTSWSNEALVWFVSNGSEQGKGWTLQYNFIDKDDMEMLPKD